MKPKKLYEDKAGNTLWEKSLKSGKIQFFAKNKKGKLVDEGGVKTMMHRAGFSYRRIKMSDDRRKKNRI